MLDVGCCSTLIIGTSPIWEVKAGPTVDPLILYNIIAVTGLTNNIMNSQT